MKLSNARDILRDIIRFNMENAGGSNASYLSPILWSLPGEGKTTMVEDLTEELGIECRTVVVAQFDPGELGGFPMVDKEKKEYFRARPFFMPTSGMGVLFFDEAPQAPTAGQNLLAQMVNERRNGEHLIPEGWTIILAGNPLAAKAGTNPMPSHLKDRLIHLDIETDHEGFREYALANDFDAMITSYIFERPEWLQKFNPAHNASPSPRSWEKVNTILKLNMSPENQNNAIQGIIGEGGMADFTGYIKIWQDLPKLNDIFANPGTHWIPEDPSVMYALCSNLAHKANKSNVKAILTYINRFQNKEFTAFCVKDMLSRNPELKAVPEVTKWFFEEGQHLML